MPRPAFDVAVVGAGVFGLTTALRLARAGLRVRLIDRPPQTQPSASAVAAGMLAPVSETLAEDGDREHLRRLLEARDLWPEFAQSVRSLSLDRMGVDLVSSSEAAVNAIFARLSQWGIESRRLLPPRLGVHLVDDWRLDPIAAIAALRAALEALGVTVETVVVETGHVAPGPPASNEGLPGARHRLLVDARPLHAERIVIAAGYSSYGLAPVAPELDVLRPIKGQLVAFAPGGPQGATVRGDGFYLAPQVSGARFGATMQADRDDVRVEPEVLARQHGAAIREAPDLAALAYRGEAGVRAATPDGWPLVGASVTPNLFLATGARRNGWLLAPLVSQMVADQIVDAAPHPLAQAFHPGRFTR